MSRRRRDELEERERRRRRLRLLAAGLALVAAALAGAWLLDRSGGVDLDRLPEPALERMSSNVVERLTKRREAVVAEPRSAAAWGRYGEALDAHRLYDEALVCYDAAIALAPREFRWRYHRAMVMQLAHRDPGEVLAALEDARALDPRHAPLYYHLGTLLLEGGDLAAAMGSFRKVIELSPDDDFGHLALGEALLSADRVDEGVRELERANAITPGVKRTLSALARGYGLQGLDERARETAELAEATEQKVTFFDQSRYEVGALAVDPASLRARAEALQARGDHAAAIPNLLLLLEEAPESQWVLVQLARSYAETGRQDVAARYLERCVELQPDDALAHLRLGRLYSGSGEPERALVQLARAAELEPERAETHALVGRLLDTQGRLPEAIARYRRALSVAPVAREGNDEDVGPGLALAGLDRADVHARLGTALGRTGDVEGARRELQRALELGPDDASTRRNLASALMRLGRWVEALPHLQRVLELSPADAGLEYQVGVCLERLGRRDEALERYRASAATDPSGPAAERVRKLAGRAP